MTPSQSAAIVWSLGIFLSLCGVDSKAQGTKKRTERQPPAIFSLGPIVRLRKGMDAWPNIVGPRSPATDRANAIISEMTKSTVEALHDCDDFYRQSLGLHGSARVKADWERKITVTMRGPRFVAMTVGETSFCGGAYPMNDHAAVVFDMTTGELVNWAAFLTVDEDATALSGQSNDGAASPEIVMAPLTELAIGQAIPECKSALEESGDVAFQVWPDAKRGQLMIKATGQPHVTQGCEETIGLSISEARKLGFSSEVLNAIEQAHRIEDSIRKK